MARKHKQEPVRVSGSPLGLMPVLGLILLGAIFYAIIQAF